MYIKKIKIDNYRNFDNFSMEFSQGLNVIVGANNSGKTGLLYAIKLLSQPSISVHDFNKNNLLNYMEKYSEKSPKIIIEYVISHTIDENDTEDESIIKLISFLGMEEIRQGRKATSGTDSYEIIATVRAEYSLDPKKEADYKKAFSTVMSCEGFIDLLESFCKHYLWTYTNGSSDTSIEKKEAIGIFDIRFIAAERTSQEVNSETKRELDAFAESQNNADEVREFRKRITDDMRQVFSPALKKVSDLVANEQNEIGLSKGNVSIAPCLRPSVSLTDSYVTEIMDTRSKAVLPLEYNGLGYNNLINIYMLIRLNEIRKGKDFRILCLEEPEAHLHPAMQYKLFKYLSRLDEQGGLNQQIFVTTHSSNISAVAGLDSMYMLAYEREGDASDCRQQNLAAHFDDKQDAKRHLAKFLDATRSDMLFADKVILVEGIAERLLLPAFMDKCGYSYEDEHVSIVEIGGKHFHHFIELFNDNAVRKKVLCITDNDFRWDADESKGSLAEYKKYKALHIAALEKHFTIDNLGIMTQSQGGRTFEDELFFANIDNTDVAIALLKLMASDLLVTLIDKQKLSFPAWLSGKENMDGRLKGIKKHIEHIEVLAKADEENRVFYESLFFAQMFTRCAAGGKGETALAILANAELLEALVVPDYICGVIKWLSE